MANNEIGLIHLNNENKKSAIKRLKELKQKELEMKSKTEIIVVKGKKTIVTKYFK